MTIRHVFFLLLLLTSSSCFALLGAPINTSSYAFGTGPASVTITDPDGERTTTHSSNLMSLAYSDWWHQDIRYWLQWQLLNADSQARGQEVGQSIQQQSVSLSLQKIWPLHSQFKPWLDIGLQAAYNQYSLRHTISDDGYLQQRFADRSSLSLGLITAMQAQWEMQHDWSVGFRAQQTLVPGNNINYRSINLLLHYQP
ncbi:MAG: hypothetical protein OEW58_12155 [Gammaproteobacteria bacterium]|nr:hypothetical protein [Gammaproteobacteria bacterium]